MAHRARLIRLYTLTVTKQAHEVDLSRWARLEPEGAVCCPLGWAALDPEFTAAGLTFKTTPFGRMPVFRSRYNEYAGNMAAAEFFGLSLAQAAALLSPELGINESQDCRRRFARRFLTMDAITSKLQQRELEQLLTLMPPPAYTNKRSPT